MAEWKHQFGFIGMGNMGYAILKGLLGHYAPSEITFHAKTMEKMQNVSARTDVQYAPDNQSCAGSSRYVILAVKPQFFDTVIGEIRDTVSEEQVIISLAPGITAEDLKNRFGRPCRIVRAMPNTPALVGEGMTGVSWEKADLSGEEQETLREMFESFGKMMVVEERLMDALSCASGSSPAYVYMFIEALADSVVKYGIPRAAAYELAAQTVLGSARMVLETGEHPGVLKDRVCSPGGTTIEGVAALEEHGMRNAVLKATDACYKKCRSMK